ncbi:TPA: relaxase/mobilization nuclease domain-containing protein [Streptococcus pneumoniae]|uniref:SAG1250 family conjugative relaxase n=1 Tax=Streptococcus pneumoniae TaxID=1313 RepID=UPI000769244E|nr:SAG1250 family conjugative relaxase [Streptococcus pneumoniae]VJB40163.1 Tn5252, relaxase [Streptococcus pneumoniae]HEU8484050.1 relaxase/mobilization nuclease domain-containing protein [Streptococcus pneumoniae]HEW0226181.1 relaxase/mobilization nuclease domain-containing protein [Streptococcus pneumoniae]HEW0283762.1 relaxase/mobilization nuclease domain-containing protein [Streptococcus pneumoniae]HEW8146910.1 relaxase/mobilization nuclease domain-containing protein [Streptococcus pneumo
MVITKHFAIHGKSYRRKLIKYILNPEKTNNLALVSDYGMKNFLDFPSYEEMVQMYHENFISNDTLYDFRHDRMEENQRKIHAHHIIQSFSPEDHLTPEQINRIDYETVKELTGGKFRFIVATHVDKDHLHNHIIINSVDSNSDKKLKWDYKVERNLRMISDRFSKIAGAKIIENRYSHQRYEVYRKTNHKYELKQRLYFLMEHSRDFEDFKKNAPLLHVEMDFRHKHATFFITDSTMKQVVRGKQLNRKQPYTEEFFKNYFAKREIESLMEFLLLKVENMDDLLQKAKLFGLTINPKQKHVSFQFAGVEVKETELDQKNLYDVEFFQDYFKNRKDWQAPETEDFVQLYQEEKLSKEKELPSDEKFWESYQEFKSNRDAVHEFEVELSLNQIEKVVDDGIYVKVKFGIRQEGLIFVPNMQLDMEEDKVKVFIRETSSYYVYHKDAAEKNCYMKGRTLIRQFSYENQTIPLRRKATVDMIKEKIAEVDALIELEVENQSYVTIKDELVHELAASELRINEVQERMSTLNQVAEYLLASVESKQEMKLNLSKLNITENISANIVEKKLKSLGNQLELERGRYEKMVVRLDKFINRLNTGLSKGDGIDFQK